MNNIKDKKWSKFLTNLFISIGEFTYTHAKLCLAAYAIFVAILVWQLQYIRIDTTFESFLRKDDPALQRFESFRRIFGRDELITIGLEPDQVFDLDFLRTLQKLHERMEAEVPYVYEVDSLINVRNVYGKDDELIVEDLFEQFPTNQTELDHIQALVKANPVYQGTVISANGKMTALTVKLAAFIPIETGDPRHPIEEHNLSDAEFAQAIAKIKAILAEYPSLAGRYFIGGTIPMSVELSAAMNRDFTLFSALCMLLIAIVLFVIFRTLAAVFLPLTVMLIAMIGTISFMAIANIPLQLSTTILPSFLLAACVGASIHWLSHFYQRYQSSQEKHQAILSALEHAGLPMFFTTLTTAAGLASFATAKITPVSNLGLCGAVGAIAAFVITITLMPILVALSPIKPRPVVTQGKQHQTRITRFSVWSAELAINRPWPIIIACIGLTLASAWFLKDTRYSQNALYWFPESSPLRQSVQRIESTLGGTMVVEMLLDTGQERGIINPQLLQTLDELMHELETYNDGNVKITKVVGLPALIKETNRGVNNNQADAYVIPDDPDLIGQELLLVEMGGGKDLMRMIDGKYQKIRTTIMLPWIDAIYYSDFLNMLENKFQAKLGQYGEIWASGMTPIMARTVSAMISSMGRSYLFAITVISLMMILLLGNFKQGLVSMFPNILPITMVLAFMAVINSPLDMFSMLVGSIALGICVDDTVHFMHGFGRIYAQTGDYKQAIRDTLRISGQGMVTTSIVLAIGFSIYQLSALRNLDHFGMLTAVCVGLALLADFWLAAAIMAVMNRNKSS